MSGDNESGAEKLETAELEQDSAVGRAPEGETSNEIATDELLKTKVDQESVVNFIEGMVQAMGSAAAGQTGFLMSTPQRVQQQPDNDYRRFQNKTVSLIMQKLQKLEKYPDLAKEVQEDSVIHDWLNKNGCKQKDYYEEFECAQALTSFFGGYRRFELAIKAASKALSITSLHRREDEELLAELNWVLADLHAADDKMEQAMNFMRKCLAVLEPGSDESNPTYQELLTQLQETNEKSRSVLAV